jgi:hypothetical protein
MATEQRQAAANGLLEEMLSKSGGPPVAIRGFVESHDGTPVGWTPLTGIDVPEFSVSEDCEALERKIAARNQQIDTLEDEQQQALNQIGMLFAKLKAEVRQERLKLRLVESGTVSHSGRFAFTPPFQ